MGGLPWAGKPALLRLSLTATVLHFILFLKSVFKNRHFLEDLSNKNASSVGAVEARTREALGVGSAQRTVRRVWRRAPD